MTAGAPTLGGLRRFNTITVQNLTVTGNLTTSGSISDGSDITLATGKALQPDTTTGHTALLKAYDVDGTAYKTFLTLTNGNTPSMAIAAPSGGTVTIDGAVIGGTTAAAITATTIAGTAITGSSTSVSGALTARNATATPAAASAVAALLFSTTANLGIYWGSGSPSTALTAAQGSLYLATDGSSTSTRAFINTNGTTGWAAITTAS